MKQRLCYNCSCTGSFNNLFHNYLLIFVGRGGTLVESMPSDWKVVGSNPSLAATPKTLGKSFTNSLYYILYTAGMHSPRAGSEPRACFIRPSEQVKKTRNFFCMTEILLMNLNFIQLSTN